jgi:hypothetical protein
VLNTQNSKLQTHNNHPAPPVPQSIQDASHEKSADIREEFFKSFYKASNSFGQPALGTHLHRKGQHSNAPHPNAFGSSSLLELDLEQACNAQIMPGQHVQQMMKKDSLFLEQGIENFRRQRGNDGHK